MTKGIGNVEYIRQGSEVTVADQSNWVFLYQASTVKPEKWNVGDRVVTPDGRVFRFCKAQAAVRSSYGAVGVGKVNISALAPAQAADTSTILGVPAVVTGAIGSQVVTVTVGAASGANDDGAVTADSLRGGYIVIGNQGTAAQNRGIVGNTAVAAGGGTIQVYLDGPLAVAVTTGTTYIEVFQPPYAKVAYSSNTGGLYSFLGIPAVSATTGQYFWLQTWGPTWITPGGGWTSQGVVNERQVYFVGDGSINGSNAITIGTGFQKAGFIMQQDTSGSGGPPMVMLQISL